jgi:hypothetical protein
LINFVFSTASPTPKYRLIFLESSVGEGGRKKGVGLDGTTIGELESLKFVGLAALLKFATIFAAGRLTYLGPFGFTKPRGNSTGPVTAAGAAAAAPELAPPPRSWDSVTGGSTGGGGKGGATKAAFAAAAAAAAGTGTFAATAAAAPATGTFAAFFAAFAFPFLAFVPFLPDIYLIY